MYIATFKSVSSVGLLGIHKDDKLTFDFHIGVCADLMQINSACENL